MTTLAHRTNHPTAATTDECTDDAAPPPLYALPPTAPFSYQQIVDMLPLLLTPGIVTACAQHLGDPAAEKILAYRSCLWSAHERGQQMSLSLAEIAAAQQMTG